jgi:hypothetical protein
MSKTEMTENQSFQGPYIHKYSRGFEAVYGDLTDGIMLLRNPDDFHAYQNLLWMLYKLGVKVEGHE